MSYIVFTHLVSCCCRAATHSTPSLHQTLRRLNKELVQEDQSTDASPKLPSSATEGSMEQDLRASAAAGRDDSAAVPGEEGQVEEDGNSGSESSAIRYAWTATAVVLLQLTKQM